MLTHCTCAADQWSQVFTPDSDRLSHSTPILRDLVNKHTYGTSNTPACTNSFTCMHVTPRWFQRKAWGLHQWGGSVCHQGLVSAVIGVLGWASHQTTVGAPHSTYTFLFVYHHLHQSGEKVIRSHSTFPHLPVITTFRTLSNSRLLSFLPAFEILFEILDGFDQNSYKVISRRTFTIVELLESVKFKVTVTAKQLVVNT